MKIVEKHTTNVRGRPRTFDRNQAVDAAMRLFWDRGYEETSITDIREAIGVHAPSFYAAFGDKAQLFAEAMDRYVALTGGFAAQAVGQPTTREAVTALLKGAVKNYTTPGRPRGCLVMASRQGRPVSHKQVKAKLDAFMATLAKTLEDRIRQGRDAGEFAADVDPRSLSTYVLFLIDALALAARRGRPRAELEQLMNHAMAGWPSQRRQAATPS